MKHIYKDAVMPFVHMNGDDKETLIKEWQNFYSAIENAIEQIPSHSFHGRNHYPRGEDKHQVAREALEEIQGVLGTIRMCAEDVEYELQTKG